MSTVRRVNLVADVDAMDARSGVSGHSGGGVPTTTVGQPKIGLVLNDTVVFRVYFYRSISESNIRLDAGQQFVICGRETPTGPKLLQAFATAAEAEGSESAGEETVYYYEVAVDLTLAALTKAATNKTSLTVKTDIEVAGAGGVAPTTWKFDLTIYPEEYNDEELGDEALSDYPVPDSILTRGLALTQAIAEAESEVVVDLSGLGLVEAPAAVLPSVRMPSAEAARIFAGGTHSVSAASATITLSAAAPAAGYVLQLLVIP